MKKKEQIKSFENRRGEPYAMKVARMVRREAVRIPPLKGRGAGDRPYYLSQFIFGEVTSLPIDETNSQFLSLILFTGKREAWLKKKTMLKTNKIIILNKNKYTINFIHTSAVTLSSVNNNVFQNIESVDNSIEQAIVNERLSNLQLVRFDGKSESLDQYMLFSSHPGKDRSEEQATQISSYSESFPWLIDNNGKFIDLSKNINLFEGVGLISNYLEKRFNMDPNIINEKRLTELLEIFKEDREGKKAVTVLDLFKYVSDLYDKDKDSFKTTITEKIAENTESDKNLALGRESLNQNKPLGKFGDITLNEIVDNLQNCKWEYILNKSHITFHALPIVVNAAGYGLMMRSYYKFVYNRPFPTDINTMKFKNLQKHRDINLALFAFIGAPFAILLLRKASISSKDMITVQYDLGSFTDNSNNDLNRSGLFLFLAKLNNKRAAIPNSVKLFFKFLFGILLILKLLGVFFNIGLNITNTILYLKIFFYLSWSLAFIYQLSNLFLLNKFINKNIKISEVLPEFLINWLKDFEELSSNKESIKEFKKSCYINISIYIVMLIIFILFI